MSHGAAAASASVTATANATAPPSALYAVGATACSFAMQSVHETKENFLMVCIGFLEALDSLQTKLNLPTSLVKELKRRLSKMVDRSLARPVTATTHDKLQRAESLGERITESEAWAEVAKPEEVNGFVNWLLAVLKSLNDLALAGSVGVCRRVFVMIMSIPGVPTTCSLFCRIFEMVERTLHLTGHPSGKVVDAKPRKSKRKLAKYMADPSMTAVVLEYREKDFVVPMNINRRIQQVMHFQIPLRSFEATVRLPAGYNHGEQEIVKVSPLTSRQVDAASESSGPSSASPRSIPVSPLARKKYELIYSNFSDDVLYQARDRLRQERAATLTGDRDLQIPRFNYQDCNEEIYLTCGRHFAVKEGAGMYRSVRGTVPVLKNRFVYFEMAFSQTTSPMASKRVADSDMDLSVCVGLSTRSMQLNTLVGTSKYSVGFYSAGHVLVGGQRRSFASVNAGYSCPSSVGVLVYVNDETATDAGGAPIAQRVNFAQVEVRFCVDGVPLRDTCDNILVAKFALPSRGELYPTLSLHTQGVRVCGRFSAPDIVDVDVTDFNLPRTQATEIWCLDGLRLTNRAAPVPAT